MSKRPIGATLDTPPAKRVATETKKKKEDDANEEAITTEPNFQGWEKLSAIENNIHQLLRNNEVQAARLKTLQEALVPLREVPNGVGVSHPNWKLDRKIQRAVDTCTIIGEQNGDLVTQLDEFNGTLVDWGKDGKVFSPDKEDHDYDVELFEALTET